MITGGFDFVDVRDVVIGLTLAAEKGRTGENYLLTGHMLNMKWAFNMAARITGRRGPIVAFPLSWIVKILPVAEPVAAKFGSDVVSRAAMEELTARRSDESVSNQCKRITILRQFSVWLASTGHAPAIPPEGLVRDTTDFVPRIVSVSYTHLKLPTTYPV